MLYAHYSNRVERLAATLAAVIRDRASAPAPLSDEIVVVNNAGMGRWLQLEVARANGIAANVRMLFPAEMTWRLMKAALPDVPPDNPFEPRFLAWHLYRLLDDMTQRRGFEAVDRYTGGDDYRRWTLARRLAGLFDQYVVFRPDWIADWEAGESHDWQADLWRALIERLGDRHWARLHRAFVDAMATNEDAARALPPRVSVFGIPTLSPGYLDLLAAAGRHVDVHLYWFNPCRQFWADIVTPREAGDSADAGFERGNSLLANWGRQGRETLDLLQDISPLDDEDYVTGDDETLLAAIQQDVLDLVERGETGSATWPAAVDDSIAIHACHGPMREIEVLHDQLLARFAADPGLDPDDVLVMTPDIETYAPYIDAVFSTAPAHLRIPFAIADRGLRSRMPVIQSFLALLKVVDDRATPEYVMGLLQTRAVAAAFELSAADLDAARRWIDATAIRWGFDAAHRDRLGLAGTDEHTWRAGLDRLLLGYAMPADRAFGGVLPWPSLEPAEAQALGRFLAFVDALEVAERTLSRSRALADWSSVFSGLIDRFFAPDGDEREAVSRLRDTIVELATDAAPALGDRPVPLEVVRECLTRAVEDAGGPAGFLGGGVTFCSMVPMRSIPFDLICLVGMNDDAFPRLDSPSSLDRMARQYRRGDRSRREDDRYLFLEILLSARKAIYISYVGRDIRDNSESPPSVVVSELLDYVRQGLPAADAVALSERLVTEHSLQAFSRRYFENAPRYPGYVPYLARAATAMETPRAAPRFVESALDPPDDTVALADFIFFYCNPARSLLRQRYGIWLDDRDESLYDREPFALDRDAGETVRRTWLERFGGVGDLDDCEAYLRQQGVLPHAVPGRIHLEREIALVEPLRGRIEAALASGLRAPASIDLEIEGMRVVGVIDGVRETGLFRYRLRKVNAPDRLVTLIEHLAGCAAGVLPGPSTLLTTEGSWCFEPIARDDALERLAPWIERYREGMRAPLHFFPRAAWAWFDGRHRDDPNEAARRAWHGSRYGWPERDNAYYRKVFGATDPIDDAFEDIVRALLLPAQTFMSEWSA